MAIITEKRPLLPRAGFHYPLKQVVSAKCIPVVLYLGAIDSNDIKTDIAFPGIAAQVVLSGTPQFALFVLIHRILGHGHVATAIANFHQHQSIAITGDDINLRHFGAEVALLNAVSTLAQVTTGQVFLLPAPLAGGEKVSR